MLLLFAASTMALPPGNASLNTAASVPPPLPFGLWPTCADCMTLQPSSENELFDCSAILGCNTRLCSFCTNMPSCSGDCKTAFDLYGSCCVVAGCDGGDWEHCGFCPDHTGDGKGAWRCSPPPPPDSPPLSPPPSEPPPSPPPPSPPPSPPPAPPPPSSPPSPPPPPSPPASPPSPPPLGWGVATVTAVGAAVLASALLLAGLCWWRRRARKADTNRALEGLYALHVDGTASQTASEKLGSNLGRE